MGREAKCTGEFGGGAALGKLLLETDDLIFRGPRRLVVPRADICEAAARNGWLEIAWAGGRARFEVGPGVDRWVQDILHPKGRIDKLDVKPDSRVALVQVRDDAFTAEVRARAATAATRLGAGPYDLIFYRIEEPAGLDRLAELRARLQPAGAVWVITPKGVPALGHVPIVAAARRAGLVDTKTARYSETHTTLKLVIPKAKRR